MAHLGDFQTNEGYIKGTWTSTWIQRHGFVIVEMSCFITFDLNAKETNSNVYMNLAKPYLRAYTCAFY